MMRPMSTLAILLMLAACAASTDSPQCLAKECKKQGNILLQAQSQAKIKLAQNDTDLDHEDMKLDPRSLLSMRQTEVVGDNRRRRRDCKDRRRRRACECAKLYGDKYSCSADGTDGESSSCLLISEEKKC